MRPAALLRLLLLLQLSFLAAAQPELIIGGSAYGRVDQQTVPGVSYAPAHTVAAALGAQLELLDTSLSLQLGGRLLQLRIIADPDQVQQNADMAAVNGQPAVGYPAVSSAGGPLVPVKTVAEAFGGFVTVLSGTRDAVEVRLPRARLSALTASDSRVSIEVSAPVPVSHYFNERLNTVHIQFRRTEPASLPALQGDGTFSEAWLLAGQDGPELRISLAPDTSYRLAAEPTASGWRLSVHLDRATPADTPAAPLPTAAGRVVLLDPAADRQLLDLAQAVATQLRTHGLEVLLSRDGADLQATSLLAADRADLYLQLGSSGSLSVYWLADASDETALQQATSLAGGDRQAVDRLRRRVLLGGYEGRLRAEQQAEQLSRELNAAAYGLPLTGLAVSSGHGLLLNVPAAELTDPGLATRIVNGVLRALEQQ